MKLMNCKKCWHCVFVDKKDQVTCNAFLDENDEVKTFSRPCACMFFKDKKKIEKENEERFQEFLKEIKDTVHGQGR